MIIFFINGTLPPNPLKGEHISTNINEKVPFRVRRGE